MTRKFYHAQNANRTIAGQRFEVYSTIGGTAWGVLATTEDAVVKELDQLVQDPKSAVTAIDEAEYEASVKKKLPSFVTLNPSATISAPKPEPASIKGSGAAVVTEEPVAPVVEIKTVVETTEDALKLAEVEPAAPVEAPAEPARKRK